MKICTTVQEMRALVRESRAESRRDAGEGARATLGFVPTMGALHEGHLSLVRAAKAQCEVVAVSIFVNPTQFGPTEDFSKYPRTFERDCELLEKEGVDVVFAPTVKEMYPAGATTFVTVEGLSERLCGRSRPGHFRGVTTVVAKLFHIVEPDKAFFGQKDAAQVAVIRRMVRDLRMAVQIVVCPIVREADGLAMSSRNAYLDAEQRKSALVLSRALREVESVFARGERDVRKLIAAGKREFETVGSVRLDYIEVVDPESLEAMREVNRPALVAVAAFVGTTRLIDNVVVEGAFPR